MKKFIMYFLFTTMFTIKIVDYYGGPIIVTEVGKFNTIYQCRAEKEKILNEYRKNPSFKWFYCVEKY